MAEVSAFYQELGRRVRERRVHLNLSQEHLARQVELTRSSVANLEAGQQRISAETLMAIAIALGMDPNKLLPVNPMPINVEYMFPTGVANPVKRWIKTTVQKAAAPHAVGTST